jgi:hypothetical protein
MQPADCLAPKLRAIAPGERTANGAEAVALKAAVTAEPAAVGGSSGGVHTEALICTATLGAPGPSLPPVPVSGVSSVPQYCAEPRHHSTHNGSAFETAPGLTSYVHSQPRSLSPPCEVGSGVTGCSFGMEDNGVGDDGGGGTVTRFRSRLKLKRARITSVVLDGVE